MASAVAERLVSNFRPRPHAHRFGKWGSEVSIAPSAFVLCDVSCIGLWFFWIQQPPNPVSRAPGHP